MEEVVLSAAAPTCCSTTRTMGLGSATVLFDYLCAAASFRLLSGCFPLSSSTASWTRVSGLDCSLTTVHGHATATSSYFLLFFRCSLLLYFSLTLTLSVSVLLFCTCRVVHRGKFSELSTGCASLPRISFPACCGYVK